MGQQRNLSDLSSGELLEWLESKPTRVFIAQVERLVAQHRFDAEVARDNGDDRKALHRLSQVSGVKDVQQIIDGAMEDAEEEEREDAS